MSTPPVLVTSRLTLRALVPADAVSLFPLFSDADTMRWWSSAPFTNIPALAAWLAAGGDRESWTVWHGEEAIGRVTIAPRRPGVAEVSYLLSREHWGQGFAREAVGAVVTHAFATRGLRRIFADTDPDNAASIGTLAALGFTFEGRLRAEWETHIGVRDSLIFGLLRDEWTG